MEKQNNKKSQTKTELQNKKIKQLSIIITLITILTTTWLLLNRQALSFTENPLSAIGNIPANYFMFLLGTGIAFYFVTLFLIKIHLRENIKISVEIFLLPIFVLLMLLIPYKENVLTKILHTIAGLTAAMIMLTTMYKINKHFFSENNLIKKITKNIPTITILGTLTFFLTSGINIFMQLFYLTTSIIWINLTAFSKRKKLKKKIKKNH